jgi:mono-ADP-ribosyltransferase sirtuin 6
MSSDNYAGRLSEYPNKGICGLPEGIDSRRTIDYKIAKLIKLMKEAKHIVGKKVNS